MADQLGGGPGGNGRTPNPQQPKPENIRVTIPASMFTGGGIAQPPIDASRMQGSPDAARMLAQIAMGGR